MSRSPVPRPADSPASDRQQPPRSRINPLGVLISLIFLAIAGVGFTGDPVVLFSQNTQWLVAGVLGLIGIGLVLTTLPGLRRRR